MIWYSHIFLELTVPIDFWSESGVFLYLGIVEGCVYFDDYVYLVPELRTQNLIVFKAEYGRRPT